jgi:hypothetical protein
MTSSPNPTPGNVLIIDESQQLIDGREQHRDVVKNEVMKVIKCCKYFEESETRLQSPASYSPINPLLICGDGVPARLKIG